MLSMEEIDALAALEAAATPGPWYKHTVDDEASMCCDLVSTEPEAPGMVDGLDPDTVVAITLLQMPRIATNDQSEENHAFLVAVRNAFPQLIETVRALHARAVDAEAKAKLADERLRDVYARL